MNIPKKQTTRFRDYTMRPLAVRAYQLTQELIRAYLYDQHELEGVSKLHDGKLIIQAPEHHTHTRVVEGDWIISKGDGYYTALPDAYFRLRYIVEEDV